MAEEEKPKEVQQPRDGGDRGAVTEKVSREAEQDRTAASAMTDKASLDRLTTNLSTLDPRRDGGAITVALNSPYQGALKGDGLTLSAPPGGDAGLKPGGDGKSPKPATDAAGLMKTDGKIDLPPKPENMSAADYEKMSKTVEALNKHLNDPKNKLTDQQKRDLERSAEQMLSNKNPDGSDRRPPLDPKEATKVLEQANRMFDNREQISKNFDGKLSDAQQNQLITAMVHDVATPTHANQGMNNTCNVSAAAKAEMMSKPGAQTERFVNMYTSTTGTVDMPDGKGGTQKVAIDRNSLIPDREADFTAQNPGGGGRDAYMQGLNHLYVNAVTQQRGEYYTDGRPQFEGDTGERLHQGGFDGEVRKKPDGRVMNSPGFGADDVQNIMNMTGAGSMAVDKDRFGGTDRNLNGVNAGDPKSLDDAWTKNGGKPMVIAVDTNSAMFRSATDVGGKTAGGGHVVTLADRRENPPGSGKYEYLLQNSWGEQHNGWVSGDAIASAMNPNKGDRSGAVPPSGSGDGGGTGGGGKNWGDQTYHRPSSGDSATHGDGSGYGNNNNKPVRDSDGIKSGDSLKQEIDQRKKIAEEEEQRLKDIQKKRDLDEQEKQLWDNLQKQKKLWQEEEEAKKRAELLRRMSGGDGGGQRDEK